MYVRLAVLQPFLSEYTNEFCGFNTGIRRIKSFKMEMHSVHDLKPLAIMGVFSSGLHWTSNGTHLEFLVPTEVFNCKLKFEHRNGNNLSKYSKANIEGPLEGFGHDEIVLWSMKGR